MGRNTSLSELAFLLISSELKLEDLCGNLSTLPFPKRKDICCNNKYGHQYSFQSTPCLLGPARASG